MPSIPSIRVSLILVPVLALAMAGCSYAVQTTSGADYLSGYSESGLIEEDKIDQRVREVAAIEPNLQFPARIGLARIDRGGLSPIPSAEAGAWAAAAERLGPTFGTFVPVNRLIAEIVAPQAPSPRGRIDPRFQDDSVDGLRRVVEQIRLGAARQHLDAVLIYQTHYTADTTDNLLSIADWTIIGAFMLPGQSIDATAFASALLVDVRNGYPYGTADTVVDRETIASTWGSDSVSAELGDEARSAAALLLVEDVEQMMLDLKQELDVASAAESDAWR